MRPAEMPLADVPLDALLAWKALREHRVDGDHSRWILVSPSHHPERLAWKIWNPGYVRRDGVRLGFDSGLYGPDVVPGFRALLTHRGLCRGYVMSWGGRLRIPPEALILALWERTRRSRHFAFQYTRSHMARAPEGPTLIDLETVHPVEALPALRARGLAPEDPGYAALVAALVEGRPGPDAVRTMARAHLAARAGPRDAAGWARRKAGGLRIRAGRQLLRLRGDGRDGIDLS